MNATNDPWTEDEVRDALNKSSTTGEFPDRLLTHVILLMQRATIALESIARELGPQSLIEEVPHGFSHDAGPVKQKSDPGRPVPKGRF
jgi:hypothetical protein